MTARNAVLLGVVPGLASDAYHATAALGASGLKCLAKSPAHYFGQYLDPARPVRDTTPSMKAGTLLHCMLLESEQVQARYAVRPEGLDGRTKEGKAWLTSVPDGVETITSDQMLTAQRQAAALRSLPDVAQLLGAGQPEQSAFWIDEDTQTWCKVRPDWVHAAGGGVILFDAKTCQDASPLGFGKAVANYSYHLQAAFYSEGWEQATGQRVLGFVFGAVEADFPHCAAPYMLDTEALTKAAAEVRRLLALHESCTTSGRWPGYQTEIQPLTLPAWAI